MGIPNRHLFAALAAISLSGAVLVAPSGASAQDDTAGNGGEGEGEGEGESEEGEGTQSAEEADDTGVSSFDNGYQGIGPAELANETGGCVSQSAVGVGAVALMGLAATRRRRSGPAM